MTSIGGKVQETISARLLEHEKLVHKVMGSKRLLKAVEEAAGMISLTLASGGRKNGRGWQRWRSPRIRPS